MPLEHFTPATRQWFSATFTAPTAVQQRGWEVLRRGHHALLIAPTGSGKTLAAFLAGIDACLALPADAPPAVRVLYVSPLKALVHDVERNLRAPLVGISRAAQALGRAPRAVGVDIRTGDTAQADRRRQARDPADILVTTPESLYLILGSKARATLTRVHTVIVDEVHAVAGSKRGAHLALSLERLSELTEHEPQRIGLSATVRPAAEVARFLGGDRTVKRVDVSARPALDLQVCVPTADMTARSPPPAPTEPDRGGAILAELHAQQTTGQPPERGIWATLYPRLLDEIRACRSTILFVNSRGLCERLTQRLNELAGEELVSAHHGSVSHARRREIEEGLKTGQVRAIVATSSLELGIDMGAVDRVLMVESPGSVARGLQRIGRAGHSIDRVSSGRVYPKFRGDLLECTLVAARMLEAEIEPLQVPRNPLDVLAQQLVAICATEPRRVADIEALVTRAAPFRQLGRAALDGVLEMLAGRYANDDLGGLRPLLSWDRAADLLSPRRGAAMTARLNAGTIPDRGTYSVQLGSDGPRLGELDEEMVFETRPGETILLGASSWRVEEVTRDRVLVSPAPGEPGRLPFWRGDGPGRPIELGRAIGAFLRELAAIPRDQAVTWLQGRAPLDDRAAQNLADYVADQRDQGGAVPTDRRIVVERFRDELGDWRVCLLTPFGARVHAPLAMALQQRLSVADGIDTQLMYTDDGIVLRVADADEPPDLVALLPDPDEVEELVTQQLPHTALFAGLFRENAARALLLPRLGPDRRRPLWAQRLKAQQLLAAVRRYPAFPMVIETYRQALSEVFDLAALKDLLGKVRSRRVRVVEVDTDSASPFARSLVFAYVAAYIYEQDAPLAERRAQALTLDRRLLAELLGEAELRELIDAEVLDELEADLQQRSEHRRARDPDELHDLLRRIGDLDQRELDARCDATDDDQLAAWLAGLQGQLRAIRVSVAGQPRWIAAEDAALYRDALGVMPPAGLPDAFLEAAPRPFERLLGRYARHRGPFSTAAPAARYALPPAQVLPVLEALEGQGVLVQGELRPGGREPEWCHTEVLRLLKRGTLARLRKQVAPVDALTLARFLPAWHGIGSRSGGPDRLLDVIAQLEGLPLPWSALHRMVLPARIANFSLDMLDTLAASGALVWVGQGALGARDGRIALYRREQAALLLDPPAEAPPDGAIQQAIMDFLGQRGASFLVELEDAVRARIAELRGDDFEAALWDLVWAGRITNDSCAPLRALGGGRRRAANRPAGARGGRPSPAWSSGGRRPRRPGTSVAGGRWSLVSGLRSATPTDTERTLAQCEQLLERYGVVSREAARAEDLTGGFAPLYRVLAGMEEAGRVRRGWFVDGLSGTQFALPGAVDRLRAARPFEHSPDAPAEVCCLATLDPASPWGALLGWPPMIADNARPRRSAGTWVIAADGQPLLYVGAGARQLYRFRAAETEPERLAAALQALRRLPVGGRRRTLVVERVDGQPVAESPLNDTLRRAGFVSDYRGLVATDA